MRTAVFLASLSAVSALYLLAPLSVLGQVRTARTAEVSSTPVATPQARSQVDETARTVQQMWGLSAEEMQRAKILALGPRSNFSVKELSPLEILGIHARSDAERRQYAERLARIFHQDVERSILWDREMQAAMARLYPNEPMISYEGLPRVPSSVGAADMLNIPRTQILEKPSAPVAPVRGKH